MQQSQKFFMLSNIPQSQKNCNLSVLHVAKHTKVTASCLTITMPRSTSFMESSIEYSQKVLHAVQHTFVIDCGLLDSIQYFCDSCMLITIKCFCDGSLLDSMWVFCDILDGMQCFCDYFILDKL